MFLRESGEERFGHDWKGFEFVTADRKREKSQVDGGRTKAFKKDGSDFFDDGNFSFWEFPRELGQMRWEEIWGDGRNDTNRNGAAHGVFLLGKIAAGGFEFAEDGAGAGKKRLADFGEAHGTAEAVEEASAEFVFEFADLLGERGLRDVGLAGGAAEAAGVDNGAEVAELVEFHERIALRCCF